MCEKKEHNAADGCHSRQRCLLPPALQQVKKHHSCHHHRGGRQFAPKGQGKRGPGPQRTQKGSSGCQGIPEQQCAGQRRGQDAVVDIEQQLVLDDQRAGSPEPRALSSAEGVASSSATANAAAAGSTEGSRSLSPSAPGEQHLPLPLVLNRVHDLGMAAGSMWARARQGSGGGGGRGAA